MHDGWRTVDVFLPGHLEASEVKQEIRNRVLRAAAEGGEFVQRIRFGSEARHADGWRKWHASYLPGPPGVFAPGRMSKETPGHQADSCVSLRAANAGHSANPASQPC
jgi:hypothetical protein